MIDGADEVPDEAVAVSKSDEADDDAAGTSESNTLAANQR